MIVSILIGSAFGLCGAVINFLILNAALKKNSTKAISIANSSRTFIDIAFIAAIYLLRNVLPCSYAPALVCDAIVLSLGTIFTTFYFMKKK